MGIDNIQEYITNNSWLVTPIIAAIGWCQTFPIAFSYGRARGFAAKIKQRLLRPLGVTHEHDKTFRGIAARRYTGLAKHTLLAALLAKADLDDDTITSKKIIWVMTVDCGLSTQLTRLDDPEICDAGSLEYITFIIQLAATIYGVVTVTIMWTRDEQLSRAAYDIQFQQQLAALTNNRGMWSIATLGAFAPPCARKRAIYWMAVVSLVLELVFTIRGFLIGWRLSQLPDIDHSFSIIAWLLPCAEALTLICGFVAAKRGIEYISRRIFYFVLPVLWLYLGAFIIIGVSIGTHYGFLDCVASEPSSMWSQCIPANVTALV